MTKDEALKLALEALKHFEKAGLATLKTIDAITAIKEALAQPVIDKSAAIRIATALGWEPKRKPLTDEQILEMYNEPRSDAQMIAFARAIEAAHGIKE